MGAIGNSIAIRRLSGDACSPEALHRALWDKVAYTLRATLRGSANDQVLALYLSMAASDGFADGAWYASETSLDFTFSDSAGLCAMSAYAASHWLDVVLWTDTFVEKVARDGGFTFAEIPRVPAIRRVLEARSPTLVELRDQLYHVSRCAPGARVSDDDFRSDDGIAVLTLADLTSEERLAVEAAAYSGACTCELCRDALPYVILEPWYAGRVEDVPATWTLLDEVPEAEAEARTALEAFTDERWVEAPLGPPALEALRATLAARGLEPPLVRLVPMLVQRQNRTRPERR